MNTSVNVQNVQNILEELETAFYDIPFENSDFQNKAFVVAAQQTPARAYRAVGLRMFAKIRAVKEYMFQQERNLIDIEEKEEQINDPNTSSFTKRRLRIDILQIQDGAEWGRKLLNDSLKELECLYSEFKRLPRYDRTQFENEEALHFEARLTRQLQAGGAAESLLNMHEDLPKLEKRIANSVAMHNPAMLKRV